MPIGQSKLLDISADLSLYIHIPFCISRCFYCDFYSVANSNPSLVTKVLGRILQDAVQEIDRLNPTGIPTVFIGGGTPSMIPAHELSDFLEELGKVTGKVDEFTIEANPESLSLEFLEVLKSNQVDRISMGVQTYDDDLLRWLGRPAGREALIEADKLLNSNWKGRVSRDVLSALPRKSHSILDDIDQALESHPGHISIYELVVEEGTVLARDSNRLKELPDTGEKNDEWGKILSFLKKQGYVRYEVSNFARSGHVCRHNMRYWQIDPCLGVGPGAASTLWNEQGAERRQEAKNIRRWLEFPEKSRSQEILSYRDFMLEHFMMSLRTEKGLETARFRGIFGIEPASIIPHSIEKYQAAGVLFSDMKSIFPASSGMDILNHILMDIMDEIHSYECHNAYKWPLY